MQKHKLCRKAGLMFLLYAHTDVDEICHWSGASTVFPYSVLAVSDKVIGIKLAIMSASQIFL